LGQVPSRDSQPQRIVRGLGRSHCAVGREQRQVKSAESFSHGPHEAVEIGGATLGVPQAGHGLGLMCLHRRLGVKDEPWQLTRELAVALR
jgi:hypothetical protein